MEAGNAEGPANEKRASNRRANGKEVVLGVGYVTPVQVTVLTVVQLTGAVLVRETVAPVLENPVFNPMITEPVGVLA